LLVLQRLILWVHSQGHMDIFKEIFQVFRQHTDEILRTEFDQVQLVLENKIRHEVEHVQTLQSNEIIIAKFVFDLQE
jgi:hypothetical protein